ncbi:ferrous iron transport protein B [Bacteroidota bacterium]
MTSLKDLKEGEKGIITKVKGRGAFRRRIIEMGFVRGKEVTVVKSAPLKDPIEYKIMDYEVSLRKNEARLIEVITLEEGNKNASKKNFNGIIDSHVLKKKAKEKGKIIDVALIGNPNSGKTSIFNIASHSKEHVGNYGGVTVDAKTARFKYKGYTFNITDLPGTYSLSDYSPEELYVRKHLLHDMPDVVINVLDASNLERNLYLTTQLIDMDIKVVVALNMFDELSSKGDIFDFQSLGKMLGIPFIPTIGSKKIGQKELFQKVIDVYEDRDPILRHIHINYGLDLEESIKKIRDLIRENKSYSDGISARYYAIKLLEKDKSADFSISRFENYERIKAVVKQEIKILENTYQEDTESLITDSKYGFIEGALKETYTPAKRNLNTKSKKIDFFLTSKYLSYPFFILFMWLMFEVTFRVGQYPMNWIEQFIMFLGFKVGSIMPDSMIKDLLLDGIIGGVGGVIVFLPNILILFLFISLMEDTGYMARVAFLLDKLMHKIGLHGKSFIPLLMGFGCNVPAILATRTIESKSDRFVTMLINPFMSCSARYPVYVLLISAFFDNYRGLILFALYIGGILMAATMALIFKKTMFRSNEIPFVMELPPYRMPTIRSTIRHTWFRGSQYLKKMGGTILIASLLIWLLGYFPRNLELAENYNILIEETNKKYQNEISTSSDQDTQNLLIKERDSIIYTYEAQKNFMHQKQSYIGRFGKFIEPAIAPLGFDWRMGVSLTAGIAAKEIVVSTLGVLYQSNENSNKSLIDKLKEDKQSPDGSTSKMTPIIALTFMIFILLYVPCIAVLTVIKKETGSWKWSVFLAVYTTFLAWTISFLFYQIASLIT